MSQKSCTFASQNRVQNYNKKLKYTNYSVKKLQSYSILLLMLLFCGSVSAKVDSYVGAYAQLGEWSLLPSSSQYSGSLGAAGGLGFLYEMQAGPTYSPTRFLLNVGVGAAGGWTCFDQSTDFTDKLRNQTDLAGNTFDYVYEISGRKDSYSNIAVQMPVMIGVQHEHFYMLVGAKMNASLWAHTKAWAKATTYGDYATVGSTKGIPMPEYQFFEDKKISTSQKSKLNLDIDLSFEIGGRLGIINSAVGYDVPKRKTEYRLAAFVDYGLIDVHVIGNNEMLELPTTYDTDPSSATYVFHTTSMLDQVKMNDVMSTNAFAKAVHNLTVGLKFTVLFQMPSDGKCVICSYGSSYRHGVRRSGVKYEE